MTSRDVSRCNFLRVSRDTVNIHDKITWFSKKSNKWLIGKVIKISNGSCKVQILDNNNKSTNIIDSASKNTLNFSRCIFKI
jgi:hypothetical protein